MLYSDCCGARPMGEVYTVKGCDPMGICADCRDHAVFHPAENDEDEISLDK